MYNPHYRDFYQKPLIPIGLKDKLALMEAEFAPPAAARSTHWLIALEGQPASPGEEYFHWKVSIYPSDSDGSFSWNQPYYSSPHLDCFNKAIDLAKSFENYSRNDEITSSGIQEKIS